MPSLPWTHATFWVAAVACAVAQVAIVRSVLVARAPAAGDGYVGDGHAGDGEDASRVPPARRASEVAWAVVPAIALALVLVLTWQAVRA